MEQKILKKYLINSIINGGNKIKSEKIINNLYLSLKKKKMKGTVQKTIETAILNLYPKILTRVSSKRQISVRVLNKSEKIKKALKWLLSNKNSWNSQNRVDMLTKEVVSLNSFKSNILEKKKGAYASLKRLRIKKRKNRK